MYGPQAKFFYRDLNLGILGGGQLGRMLLQAAIDLNVQARVLDPDPQSPCNYFRNSLTLGRFDEEAAVLAFGRQVDLLTLEIEHVHVGALETLVAEGIAVYPQPEVIALVQDKGRQKQFFDRYGIPTAPWRGVDDRAALQATPPTTYPAVLKRRRGGYDGRGVQVLRSPADLDRAFDAPSVLEARVDIAREISMIAVRNARNEVAFYPPVEMVFHPEANLVEYLFIPARLPEAQVREAEAIARALLEALELVGLLAVELFLDTSGRLFVNELAPRPHNSGHPTIEACVTSQFEQHLRAVLGLPPGATDLKMPAVMVNVLGPAEGSGTPVYRGIEDVLAVPGAHVHLYGKAISRPFRKLGHITVLDAELEGALTKAETVRQRLHVEVEREASS